MPNLMLTIQVWMACDLWMRASAWVGGGEGDTGKATYFET